MRALLDETGLASARTPEALRGALLALRGALGLAHLCYRVLLPAPAARRIDTYPEAWGRACDAHGHDGVDPVLQAARRRRALFDWRELDWDRPAARALRRAMAAHGLGAQGASVPVRGADGRLAVFSAVGDGPDAAWSMWCAAEAETLVACARAFDRRAAALPDRNPLAHAVDALGIAEPAPQGGSQPLSPREHAALRLLALGYSRAEAAASLSISEHTIRDYIDGARAKLGAQNVTHAVARAVATGAISL